jgi:hypothetical protein
MIVVITFESTVVPLCFPIGTGSNALAKFLTMDGHFRRGLNTKPDLCSLYAQNMHPDVPAYGHCFTLPSGQNQHDYLPFGMKADLILSRSPLRFNRL